ncbi:MAG: decarboxylase [Sandaracinaceae bacterium]|nr:decarboxylase [Sandaracinaceae bacterium]
MTDGVDRERLWISDDAMRALGHRVVDALVERWSSMEAMAIPPTPPREVVRARLAEPMPRQGRPPAEVIERAVRDVLGDAAPTGHPRFFGFIPSPSNFAAVLADALVAGFNPFGGNFVEAPGPHELERVTVGWLRDACDFDADAAGLFVSGGSMANLTALCVAREVKLGGEPKKSARIYVSEQAHGSIAKGLRVLGFRRECVVPVPTDDAFRMNPVVLDELIRLDRVAGNSPFAVVATVGTTNTGAIDPLEAISAVCRRRSLWLHVDGAYGAAARLSPRAREQLHGFALVDSLSLDPHKWLFTPYECGLVLVQDGAALARTFAQPADYLDDVGSDDEPDLQDQGIQLTRSLRALKVWMTFQVFGADAIAAAIDRGVAQAERVGRRVEAMPGWQLACPPSLAICAFRYAPDSMTDEDADALNFGLVPRLAATGEAFVTSTKLRGRRYLRMCTISPRTTDADVDRTLARLDALARRA